MKHTGLPCHRRRATVRAATFSQAILDSNNAIGATNTIDFDISSSGVQTIVPLFSLPGISNPVLIDGFSQSGYSGRPLIEIKGGQAGGGDGLTITGAGVTVRGLDIDSFSQGAGIHLTGNGATGDWICGNFLGTRPIHHLSVWAFQRELRCLLSLWPGWGLPTRPAIGLPWQRDLLKKPMTFSEVAPSG
jgi:hypothetical protein